MSDEVVFRYKIQMLLDELVILNPDEKAELFRKLAFMNAEQIGKVEELLRRALKSQNDLLGDIVKDKPNFDKELGIFAQSNLKKAYAESINLRSREIMKNLLNLKKNVRSRE